MPESFPTRLDLTEVDPEADPFVLVIGGNVGSGRLGPADEAESVDVLVNEIVYVPWNAEDQTPRKMKLVMPADVAVALGKLLFDRGAILAAVHPDTTALEEK